MNTDQSRADVVVLGELPGSSHTRGPWVAQHDRDSPPAGGALPLHDTPLKPSPVRMAATRPPPRSAFPFTAESVDRRRSGSLLSPAATKAVGVLVAVVLAIVGVLAVIVAASAVRTTGPVAWFSIAATVGCGFVLVVSVLIGRVER